MGIQEIPARRETLHTREIPKSWESPRREKLEAIWEGGNGSFSLNIPGPTMLWLLAVALLLGLAEACRLLRLCDGVSAAPRLLVVARWITSPWLGWAWSHCMLLWEAYIVVPLSLFCHLVHGYWVMDKDPVSCRGLQTSDVLVQCCSVWYVTAL